jgi:RHS repeat-associated protein
MGVSTSGGIETVTVTGSITEILRATRNYYTSTDPKRLIASASYTSRDIHNPNVMPGSNTRKFPTQDVADDGGVDWISLGVDPNARPAPANSVSLGSLFYFDVDVFDADSGVDSPDTERASNDLLNESGERTIVWTHRTRTKPGGGATYRSSRSVVDKAGRAHWTFEHERVSGTYADELTLSKAKRTYSSIASTSTTRLRGQPSGALAFADATSSTSITTWSTCSSSAFDPESRIVCRVIPQSPNNLEISEATATGPNGARRTTHTTKEGGHIRLQSYDDHFPKGPVFETGKVGGNKTITSWSTTADATSSTLPALLEERTSDGTLLVKTMNTYDSYGRLDAVVVQDGSGTVKRRTEYTYSFDDDTIESVSRLETSPSTFVTRTTVADPLTGAVNELTEEDGDVITNNYATTGVDRGRLISVERNGTVVQSFVYDVDGRVTEVINGDETVAAYDYAEDGRLERETLVAAVVSSNTHNREYFDELVQIGGTGPYYRAQRVTTKRNTTVIRDVRTISDHMGRPLRLCDVVTDSTCMSPVVQWFYDNKCTTAACTSTYASATTTYAVEGTSRTIKLTNDHMSGRLAYVKHPGGATFYEYDALGRPTLILRYEGGTLDPPGSLVTSKMKALELDYYLTTGELASMRYPSGRKVEYLYGGAGLGTTEDRRGPSEVYIYVDPNGANTIHRVVSRVTYDVDGVPTYWLWGNTPSDNEHVVTRDLLGRITEVKDVSGGGTQSDLDYTSFDGDGDLVEVVDQGPAKSILTTATTTPPFTWTFSTDADRDMLTQWNDLSNVVHTLALDADNGHRVSESVGSDTYAYTYEGEWAVLRDKAGGTFAHDFRIGTTTSGHAAFLNKLDDASFEVSSMTYGPRGDMTGYTLATGTQAAVRDENMLMWSRSSGGTSATQYRYGPSGQLIDLFFDFTTGTNKPNRDEYIYLQGIPVGVTHTDYLFPSPRTWWLGVDAAGVPRRAYKNSYPLSQKTRLVMNPWGEAQQVDDRTSADKLIYSLVALPFRHAGQLAALGSPHMIENRWRVYNPDLGVYLQPDPAHHASASSYAGPQAYAYASGRPLVMSDPTGRYSLSMRESDCESAFPVLFRVVSGELPLAGDDADFARIFTDMFGSNGASLLREGCTFRSGPKLVVGDAGGGSRTYAKHQGGVVTIDRRKVVDKIEAAPSKSWFYHVVLLHELAHWANEKSSGSWDVPPSHAGDVFETRAYGAVLQMP